MENGLRFLKPGASDANQRRPKNNPKTHPHHYFWANIKYPKSAAMKLLRKFTIPITSKLNNGYHNFYHANCLHTNDCDPECPNGMICCYQEVKSLSGIAYPKDVVIQPTELFTKYTHIFVPMLKLTLMKFISNSQQDLLPEDFRNGSLIDWLEGHSENFPLEDTIIR